MEQTCTAQSTEVFCVVNNFVVRKLLREHHVKISMVHIFCPKLEKERSTKYRFL